MNLQEAIDTPAFHIEHMPSSFWPRASRPGVVVVEGRFAPAVREDLKSRGHIVETGDDWSEGRICAAAIRAHRRRHDPEGGRNPRGMQNYALGR